jgi:hypothetical protein
MLDDVAVALPGENPSAEARMAAIVHSYELDDEPSAEGWITTAAAWHSSDLRRETRTQFGQNPSAEGFTQST